MQPLGVSLPGAARARFVVDDVRAFSGVGRTWPKPLRVPLPTPPVPNTCFPYQPDGNMGAAARQTSAYPAS